jgi:histidyl-tRNA synthetase
VRHALFIGEQELDSNKYKLRDLQKGDEKNLSVEEIVSTLSVAKE